jgi:hypothetical protein
MTPHTHRRATVNSRRLRKTKHSNAFQAARGAYQLGGQRRVIEKLADHAASACVMQCPPGDLPPTGMTIRVPRWQRKAAAQPGHPAADRKRMVRLRVDNVTSPMTVRYHIRRGVDSPITTA